MYINFMGKIKLLDKHFKKFVSAEIIQQKVDEMAKKINRDFQGKEVVFVGILNGVFMFASDLFRRIDLHARITFLRMASYEGIKSTGKVKQLMGLSENLKDHIVIIIEDIVDTGFTLEHIIRQLKSFEPAEIHVATFLFKPEAYRYNIPLDYVGMEMPNAFIVGYGLDYNGYGRNLNGLYILDETKE